MYVEVGRAAASQQSPALPHVVLHARKIDVRSKLALPVSCCWAAAGGPPLVVLSRSLSAAVGRTAKGRQPCLTLACPIAMATSACTAAPIEGSGSASSASHFRPSRSRRPHLQTRMQTKRSGHRRPVRCRAGESEGMELHHRNRTWAPSANSRSFRPTRSISKLKQHERERKHSGRCEVAQRSSPRQTTSNTASVRTQPICQRSLRYHTAR